MTIALIDGDNAKTCRVCGALKPLHDFHPNKGCSLGVVATCRVCMSQAKRGWYQRNRKARQEAQNKRNRERKRFWIERLGGKCEDCGGTFHESCYDFHHLGEKDTNPSVVLNRSYERQEEEMSKCVLLCANCHRVRHFGGEDG